MRKILSILLALCLTIGLTACSGGDSSDEATETENGSEDELKTWIEGLE